MQNRENCGIKRNKYRKFKNSKTSHVSNETLILIVI